MSIRILKLTTGEQLVADVDELQDQNGKGVGFEVRYPYTVIMRPVEVAEGQPLKFDINYVVWMPASKDTTFAIPYSSVMTFGEPADDVRDAYIKNFAEPQTEGG